jgi:ribosomal protein S18 acetylase RimI-like enzyme
VTHTAPEGVTLRHATARDALAIARIHAASWRRHYRGAYSDTYLDTDLEADRLATWTARLADGTDLAATLVAEISGSVVGFAHVQLQADPRWGSLVDNLHVRNALRGQGIGTALLQSVGRVSRAHSASSGIYLWVQEQNVAAQRFYIARGGRIGDRELISPPGGDPANLRGAPYMLRVSWPDAASVI